MPVEGLFFLVPLASVLVTAAVVTVRTLPYYSLSTFRTGLAYQRVVVSVHYAAG